MLSMKVQFLFALTMLCWCGEGRQFSKCGLVYELRRQGFPEEQMRNWICLVENESSFRTDVIGKLNTDDSWDYGLFQINDRYWCNRGDTPGKDCDVVCNELLTDDITEACACAEKIFSIQGFSAWMGWLKGCQGELPDISDCV